MTLFKNTQALSLLIFVLATALSAWGNAQEISDALRQDAVAYAQHYDVTESKAVERLKLQDDAGDLNAILATREQDRFAGMWIEHQPEFKVVVQLTSPLSKQAMADYLQHTRLADTVELRTADYSVDELNQQQALMRQLAAQFRLKMDSEIDVRTNRVNIYTLDADSLQGAFDTAGIRLPAAVTVKPVAVLAEPEVLRGGSGLTTCTAGFTVRDTSNNEQGVSTAAHCGNSQSYSGTGLPFRDADQQGNQDVQWHSSCGLFDISNDFDSGIGIRNVTGTRHRNNQVIGHTVCKNGMTTGYTCGEIASKTFAPNYVTSAASTFIRVSASLSDPDLSAGGDSGGPWFIEQIAYGTHSGGFNGGSFDGDSLYMAINYISSIGVQVLTSDPGACSTNEPPNAEFTWSNPGGTQINFDASGSSDPDGSIVSYEWDFGDGSSTTTSSSSITHYYSQENPYQVTLIVTDNDGSRGIDILAVSTCAPQIFCTEF